MRLLSGCVGVPVGVFLISYLAVIQFNSKSLGYAPRQRA